MLKLQRRAIWRDILVFAPFLLFVFVYEANLLTFYFSHEKSAYGAHVQFAFLMATAEKISIPHFLYQALVIVTGNLLYGGQPILGNLLKAGYLVSLSVTLALFSLLYVLFLKAINRDGVRYSIFSVLMAVFFTVGSAVNALYFLDKHAYFGYLPLNVYNGPTHSLLQLFSIPLFLIVSRIFIPSKINARWLVPGGALLTILATLAKPSFTVIILPAVGLIIVYRALKKEYINWNLFLWGLAAPSLAILGWQYYISFGSQWENMNRIFSNVKIYPTRIGFAPFGQFIAWEVPLNLLLPKLFLSILFPLTVYVSYWKTARRDLIFNLGWLVFLFGCISTYFFVEIVIAENRMGKVSRAGNFTWSGLIGVYTLFVAAALFFLRQIFQQPATEKTDWRRLGFVLVVMALHLVYGIFWYFDQFRVFTEKIY